MTEAARRYVILTPFKKVNVVAGICSLHHIDAWVVPSKSGSLVVRDLPVPTFSDWDISELLGDEAPAEKPAEGGSPDPESLEEVDEATSDEVDSDDPMAVALTLARLARRGVLLLQAELGTDVGNEAGVSGLITGQQVAVGQAPVDIPAGVIVNTVDSLVEELLLGERAPGEIDGAIRSSEISPTFLHKLAGKAASTAESDETEPGVKHEDSDDTPPRRFGESDEGLPIERPNTKRRRFGFRNPRSPRDGEAEDTQ